MGAALRRLLTSRREYNGSGGGAIPDTTNLESHYSQYDKNGDIELDVNEHKAHAEENVCVRRALFFLWFDNPSFAHASSLRSWISKRPAADSGNMWEWVRREISNIAEEAGAMAHARAATSTPLVWMYRMFDQNKLAESDLFADDPSGSLLLSELAEELAAEEYLQRRDGDIAFGECGSAPDAPPVGGCNTALARPTEVEGVPESRGRISEVTHLPGRMAASYRPRLAPPKIYSARSRNWRAIWRV